MPPNSHARRIALIQSRRSQNRTPEESATGVAAGHVDSMPSDTPPDEPASAAANRSRRISSTAEPTTKRIRFCPDVKVRTIIPQGYETSMRDHRMLMDLMLYRLSRKDTQASTIIHYQLPDGHVRVASGLYGMATIWDYDLVLIGLSQLCELMNLYRAGKTNYKPDPIIKLNMCDVLHVCKKGDGGSQRTKIIEALQRLNSTHISVKRTYKVGDVLKTHNFGENLISSYRVVSNPKNSKVESIEIGINDWMYAEITSACNPDVLVVHSDYFSISQGVGRFIYRLARKAAGQDMAEWGFKTLYERSGSLGTINEFYRILRKLIKAQCLPEYTLEEKPGKMGPLLRMTYFPKNEGAPVVEALQACESVSDAG
ncbi:replication initiator protein A [Pseudomonas sp. 21LCFQ010]|uniref:replication initiator protein A n=1 Tax=Pseudomonas sp. 21LCFQ010 TaxID=2957506 RepID=UPI002096955C|nr:replication initiator protein A [Pseudomonas sp. 21LCFQ010]MCO8164187.1 replication initiator protein A [Pseudomonas sp. 21LCFQ010]